MVLAVREWLDRWIEGVSSPTPTFRDPITSSAASSRDIIIRHLTSRADQIVAIVNREQGKRRARQPGEDGAKSVPVTEEGDLAALYNSYEGPGDLRIDGPRHDNDFVEINDIRIAPTHGELISRIPPYLPANLHAAPHPHPPESMERLLDIQFRLLREELM